MSVPPPPLRSHRNFSPVLFIMSSTTGLVGLLFILVPYFGGWAIDLGFALWWLSIVIFVIFGIVLIARCVRGVKRPRLVGRAWLSPFSDVYMHPSPVMSDAA